MSFWFCSTSLASDSIQRLSSGLAFVLAPAFSSAQCAATPIKGPSSAFIHIYISWPWVACVRVLQLYSSCPCCVCCCCARRRNVLICFPIRFARFFLLLCHRLRLIVCACCHLFYFIFFLFFFWFSHFCIHDTTHTPSSMYAMAFPFSVCHLIFVAVADIKYEHIFAMMINWSVIIL